ncbi:MAG: hypothetical protein QXZ19_01575 [Thermoplasmata archaeon]
MLAEEVERIVEESARKLFQIAPPPVRYYILTDLWARKSDDPFVLKTLEEIETYPPRVRLIESLRPDGTWPIPKNLRVAEEVGPGPPYGWTYITMLRNLSDLLDMRADISRGYISTSLELILSWQSEDGYIPGPMNVPFGLPNYNGLALRALLGFGLGRDPRVRKIVDWLFRCQRPDGGWLIPYLEDMRYLPQFAQMRKDAFLELVKRGEVPLYDPGDYKDVPSCIWTTMMVVRGLCHSFELAPRKEVRRGAEFFLDRFFKGNRHPALYKSESHWTKLNYPCYVGNGLCALDLLTWLGFGADDPRLERPIKWLLSARGPDGLWHATGRPHPSRDAWISEVALSVLRRYAQSMAGKPFGYRAEMLKESMARPASV